jgi:hypothetical protein
VMEVVDGTVDFAVGVEVRTGEFIVLGVGGI